MFKGVAFGEFKMLGGCEEENSSLEGGREVFKLG